MPTIDEVKNRRKFQKREYRPWNLDGKAELVQHSQHHVNAETIIQIDPQDAQNWQFNDRPSSELGDIESLAAEFKQIGQQLPCIARPSTDPQYKYEIIAGERRWHAAKLAEVKLKIIVRELTNTEAAIVQTSENLNRKSLSDYARGVSYAKLIEQGILSQKDLSEKLKLSKQQVSRLLSFDKIPPRVVEAIGDMSKISARTAEQIKQLSKRGEEYVGAITKMAPYLRKGQMGQKKLKDVIENMIAKIDCSSLKEKEIFDHKQRQIFTVQQEKNKQTKISFSRRLSRAFENGLIDIRVIINDLRTKIEQEEDKVQSPQGD